MAVYNLGSINADLFYNLPHLVQPGETLAASDHDIGLGGKGANMSTALARAGADVHHIGAVGSDGAWMVDRLRADGVKTDAVEMLAGASGHALILVEASGENAIVLHAGANAALSEAQVTDALNAASSTDTLIFQNETNQQAFAAKLAKSKGMRVAYAAAPFSADSVSAVMDQLDLLFMNEVEAQQLQDATGQAPDALPVAMVVVTLGPEGCRIYNNSAGTVSDLPAPKVSPVDTTGAGDTFTGFMLAGLDAGLDVQAAAQNALIAGAIMVTRHGTADVIPTAADVDAFKDA